MTRLDLDPELERLGEALRASAAVDLAREERVTRSSATPRRAGVLRRPRVIASSTLGLAGIGAALVLALGGSTAQPAFAITKDADGVLVKLSYAQDRNLPQVNQKLAEMGTHEQIGIRMASGPASVSGPVTCTPQPGVTGPTVRVLDGADGTEVIGAGESGGNTAEGTFHLVSCGVYPANTSLSTLRGYTGNTGG